MKVLIAPDSFKESMSAALVCESIEKGIHAVDPTCLCYKVPMADGGEGTLTSICDALDGKIVEIDSYNVFKESICMPIGVCNDFIVIESASCIGLDKTDPAKRDIWRASTYGLGIAISKALDYQPKKIMICLGGSATNDMGVGMLEALGVKFLNVEGKELHPIPKTMSEIKSIDLTNIDARLFETQIVVACDVQNPLCGLEGASYVFGPQKGASKEDVVALDRLLKEVSDISCDVLNKDICNIPGGGAAGGLGSALYGFLHATLQPGVEIVKEVVGLEKYMAEVDMVITGEGSLDQQTLQGKTCFGILQSAKKYKVPVIILAGNIKPDARVLYEYGVVAYFPIVHQVKTMKEILKEGPQNLTYTIENIFRLWQGRK